MIFYYECFNVMHRSIKGRLESESKDKAWCILESAGFVVREVSSEPIPKKELDGRIKIRSEEECKKDSEDHHRAQMEVWKDFSKSKIDCVANTIKLLDESSKAMGCKDLWELQEQEISSQDESSPPEVALHGLLEVYDTHRSEIMIECLKAVVLDIASRCPHRSVSEIKNF